jgi:hypothetical protein
MAIGIVDARALLRLGRHPLARQLATPAFGPALGRAELANLLAQGAHLRDAIQPQQLAPLARHDVAQGFQRGDARQSPEG